MIKNESQFKTSAEIVEEMRSSLAHLESLPADPRLHPELRQLEISALTAKIDELNVEIDHYRMLIENPPATFTVGSLQDFPQSLIQARIAQGMTPRDLAELLSFEEQTIQRYEAAEYAGVGFRRLIEIADALSVEVDQELRMCDQLSASALIRRLRDAGIQRSLLDRRFLRPGGTSSDLDVNRTVKLINDISRVFGWSLSDLRSSKPLVLSADHLIKASFKKPKNANDNANLAYVIYAYYLARQVAGLVENESRRPPKNWIELRDDLVSTSRLSLRGVIHYSWDLGIAVIPLQDNIAIHGAYWNLGDRSAIILKQGTRTTSRWLVDLIHELYHAATDDSGIVESDSNTEDDVENLANRFAVDVALGGRSEELIQSAVEHANGDVACLKHSVQHIAVEEGVSIGLLANATAWRMAPQHDWWSVAANLQKNEDDPWEICRDILLERVDLSRLPDPDRELVLAALRDDRDWADV